MSWVEPARRVAAAASGAVSAAAFAGMMLPVVVAQHRSPAHECVTPGLTGLWLLAGTQFQASLFEGGAPWVRSTALERRGVELQQLARRHR